jgi:uncharacterized repeat protein (TIGR03806 family)
MAWVVRCIWLATMVVAAGCGRDVLPVQFHGSGQPESLADWQLFKREGHRLRPNDGVLPYDLNTPLFSDYAHKLRTVWMPKGVSAIYRDEGSFEFPVGTIISKTFYYPRVAGEPRDSQVVVRSEDTAGMLPGGALDLDQVRLIETRLLVRREDGWAAIPYVWNAAQTEARLMRGGKLVPLTLVSKGDGNAEGEREDATYQVPDQNQCASCHGTDVRSKAIQPIGLKARHLNRTFAHADAADGRAVENKLVENQLLKWISMGYLKDAPTQEIMQEQAPRSADWRDAAHEDIDARARAYLDINCGHCHSAEGPGNTSGLWLEASEDDPLRLGRCKLPIAAGKGTGGRRYGIVPGRPDDSILTYRMVSNEPSEMMPELGRSVVHREGVALIREWIAAQEGSCADATGMAAGMAASMAAKTGKAQEVRMGVSAD